MSCVKCGSDNLKRSSMPDEEVARIGRGSVLLVCNECGQLQWDPPRPLRPSDG